MKRLLIWSSPVLGVLLGMLGIMAFRHQPGADANMPPAVHMVQPATTEPEARLNQFAWPTIEQTLAPAVGDGEKIVRSN